MDFLNSLFSLFFDETTGGKLSPILKQLQENSFDIKKTISSLRPETVLPILQEFLSKSGFNEKDTQFVFNDSTEPLKKIADEEIVATLNSYFENGI